MDNLKEIIKVSNIIIKGIFKSGIDLITETILITLEMIMHNLKLITRLLYFFLPFIMLKIGQYTYSIRGEFTIGGEVFIPFMFMFLIHALRQLHKEYFEIEKDLPIPEERFTIITGDKIEVENRRLDDLLIYMQELEDYLEEEGLTNKTQVRRL